MAGGSAGAGQRAMSVAVPHDRDTFATNAAQRWEAVDPAHHASLEAAWCNAPGWRGQFTAVNHGTIALRTIATGLGFFVLAGLLSMFMRLQLAWPGLQVLDPERYAQFVTLHGTTMMFLFAVPILEGFAMYLVPKMIGSRDLPFPRLSAFGYWCYLFGGLLLFSSVLFDAVPDGGWFMYPPLTGAGFSPDSRTDFWLLGVTFAEIAAVAAAVELIAAILLTRAPGMSLARMPLFVWYVLVTAFMIVFGFPPLILGSILLEIERAFGFVFFEVALGGDPLLWQHLFWLFGHPEVYIIFLPAAGMVSMILPCFCGRPIVGYAWVVAAVIAMGFLSFGLWVHHMFVVGIPLVALGFFSAASMAVAIPTGIQIFAWIGTLLAGRPRLDVPMYYILGFFVIFVLGGLTGVMLALVPFNWQVHDTHFVVAHMHYVLIGGMLFPLLAACYYWLPLVSGRLPIAASARGGFWLVFLGFNGTFLPMHATGLMGLPRRVDSYAFEMGVHWINLASTAASFVLAAGLLTVVLDLLMSARFGPRARRNPWAASTLEWALPMPPPNYNFARQPEVRGRDPLWQDAPDSSWMPPGALQDAPDGKREMLGTEPLSGRPEQIIRLASNSWLPLLCAITVLCTLVLFLLKFYVWALLPLAVGAGLAVTMAWMSPHAEQDARGWSRRLRLPMQDTARNAPGRWGLLLFLFADGALFASLVFAYFFLWIGTEDWLPLVMPASAPAWALPGVLLPLLAALLLHLPAGRAGAGPPPRIWQLAGPLLAAIALGALAVVLHSSVAAEQLAPAQHRAAASVSWVMLGYLWLHLLAGVLAAVFVLVRLRRVGAVGTVLLDLCLLRHWWAYSAGVAVLVWPVVHLFPWLH